jgi:transcription termination factor Rho
MTTLTGILEWPQRAEGRVRQIQGSTLVQRDDDPFVPLAFGERYKLRHGLEVTVRVGQRGGGRPPHGGHGGHGGPGSGRHGHPQGRFRGPGQGGGQGWQGPPGRHGGGRPGQQGAGGGGGGGGGGRPVVETILAIEGQDPEKFAQAKPFEELTSIDPQPRLTLEYPGCPAACRLIDLFCPIGRGQRGLIVSPPKAGKTTLLKDIATAVLRNHADVEVQVLLIDERPEEVTDFRRTFAEFARREGEAGPARCRVIGSSNDHDGDVHVNTAILAIERCKRLVEAGRHVVVLLDSLTRLGRAFNRSRKYASGGRTLTGGIDSRALEVPKQLFGAARNTEEAGSLTIVASCLVDTGSQGDQVIFEEFKGTGNMELILDRKISERRLFPAINLAQSGTRKEHLLQPEAELKTVTALRRRLMNMPPPMQVEQLLAALQRFPTNAALIGQAG